MIAKDKARFIRAAAPEMLEALRKLVEIHSQNNAGEVAERAFRDLAIRSRATIAKAMGVQS